ncbi:MAG: YfiR family protein [Vicinamibacterales bacterium]
MVRFRHAALAALVLVLLGPAGSWGQVDEYGVKAAFVRNFAAFVDWPSGRLAGSDPLVLCVYNNSPVMQRLTGMTIDPIRGHGVQVRAMTALPDLAACHLVFVPSAESRQIPDIQTRFRGHGLLTITEEPGGGTGAVINMYLSNGKMTFDVDMAAAESLGVHISSKLLGLARRVQGGSGGRGPSGN